MTTSKLPCVGLAMGFALLGVAGLLLVASQTQSGALSMVPERKLVATTPTTDWSVTCPVGTTCCTSMGYTYKCPGVYTTTCTPAILPSCPLPEGSGSSGSGTSSAYGAVLGTYFGTLFAGYGSVIAQVLGMLIFACCYWQKVVEPIVSAKGTLEQRQFQPADDFVTSICQCFDDMWVCIHGLCCPLARMGHTNEVAGILGYWETAALWCCCSTFIPFGPCCLTVYFRMKLKEIMNVKDNVLNDFVIACCCPMLAICQQGTAVDDAMGYEVVGCCDLEWRDPRDQQMMDMADQQY